MTADDEWEALCDGCGKCCEVSNTGIACPGLDTKTNRCTVYSSRLTTHVCLKVTPQNVKTLRERRVLPASCGYVRHMQGLEPLQRPVPCAVLIPFDAMPKHFKRWYARCNAEWQAKQPISRPLPPRI